MVEVPPNYDKVHQMIEQEDDANIRRIENCDMCVHWSRGNDVGFFKHLLKEGWVVTSVDGHAANGVSIVWLEYVGDIVDAPRVE
jgi:hypothetical protein